MEIDGLTYEMTLLEKVKHFKNEALKAIVNSNEDYKTKLEVLCNNRLLGWDYYYKFEEFVLPHEKRLISFIKDIKRCAEEDFEKWYMISTICDKIQNNYYERYKTLNIFRHVESIEESVYDFEAYSGIKEFSEEEKEWLEIFMENLCKEAFEFAIKNNIDSVIIDW